jgi:hypothetical protein
MKSFVKSLLIATALITFSGIASAQSLYVQGDLGGSSVVGSTGQFNGDVKAGLTAPAFFGADVGFYQGLSSALNTSQVKLSPYVTLPVVKNVSVFAGPQIGYGSFSGSSTPYTGGDGVWGGQAGLKYNLVQGYSLLGTYEYTRSFNPIIYTNTQGVDYYNDHKFTVGLRKTF